jgi:Fic family protein
MKEYPVFEFLPFETLISNAQQEYYQSLASSDNSGSSTPFIEYMLGIIDRSLGTLLNYSNRTLTDNDRLSYFMQSGIKDFIRKDYMDVFKDISTATASRDLKKGVELGILEKYGTLNKTRYRVIS